MFPPAIIKLQHRSLYKKSIYRQCIIHAHQLWNTCSVSFENMRSNFNVILPTLSQGSVLITETVYKGSSLTLVFPVAELISDCSDGLKITNLENASR